MREHGHIVITGNVRKTLFYVFIIAMIGLPVVAGILKNEHMDVKKSYSSLRNRLWESLARKLTMEKPFPEGLSKRVKNTSLIYVLGGSQGSLIPRFRKASSLYHQGLSPKILILSRPGITEFSPDLGRNLTNDEWAIRELERLNVKKEAIETVSVGPSFFGTMSEAKVLSDIVRNKDCKELILVTSDYHTRRAYTAFSRNTSTISMDLYIYGSNDSSILRELLVEYTKLILYENFPLPLSDLLQG